MSNFFLADRIKETSRIVGTVDILLDGAVNGFSSFSDFYASGDVVFYAITDNIKYEIGSGIFQPNGSSDSLTRNPLRSSDINVGPWYVDGTSNSGPTDGQNGKFYPLWLSRSAALSGVGFSDGPYTDVSGVSFDEYPGQTFYHIAQHAALGVVDPAPPSGSDFGAASAPVTFDAGLKEVFVTYPGKTSVLNGYGLEAGNKEPKQSGVAFWQNENILNYSSELLWDDANGRLGVGKTPEFPIDVGGLVAESMVRASGFIDGGSGIAFSGGQLTDTLLTASGGQQLEPFLRNRKGTAANGVIVLSGVVDQIIDFAEQPPGTIFAGPASGWCGTPPCSPQVPTFRQLDVDDLPAADDFLDKFGFVIQDNNSPDGVSSNVEGKGLFTVGQVALYAASGQISYDSGVFFDTSLNRLMINGDPNLESPSYNLDVIRGDLRAASGTFNQLIFNDNLIRIGENTGRDLGNQADNVFSVSVGYFASNAASGESYCVSIGKQAGAESTENSGVVGIGYQTAASGTLNEESIFIGSFAGGQASGVDYSVSLGYEAGYEISGVNNCNFIGVRSGSGITDSSYLTAIGSGAAAEGDQIVLSAAIGQQSMFGATNMETCYMLGTVAGSGSSGFVQAVGLGSSSFKEAFDVEQSVAIGQDAGLYVSGVSNSYYIGTGAGKSGILSDKIFAFGHSAGVETSGSFNVYIGNNAGISVSGHNNVEIIASGGSSSLLTHEASGKVNIGNVILGDIYSNRVSLGNPESLEPTATLQVEPVNADEIGMVIKHQGSGSASPYFAMQSGDFTTFYHITNSGDVITSGCVKPSGGLLLPSITPTDWMNTTTNRLYNDAGTLKWNGSALAVGGGFNSFDLRAQIDDTADSGVSITNNQTILFSGIHVNTQIDSGNRQIIVDAGELSGVLQDQIAANDFAFRVSSSGEQGSNNNDPFLMDQTDVSVPPIVVLSGISGVNIDSFQLDDGTNNSGVFVIGYDANAAFTFDFTNGDFVGDTINDGETVTISGVSGVRAEYDSSNNFFRIGASGLSGVLYDTTIASGQYLRGQILENTTSGVAISGIAEWASGEFARAGLTQTLGTSGLITQDGFHIMDPDGSGNLSLLNFPNRQGTIVIRAEDDLSLTASSNGGAGCILIGSGVGLNAIASNDDNVVAIGTDALGGNQAGSRDSMIIIGHKAFPTEVFGNTTYGIAIGYESASGCDGDFNTTIGYQAGSQNNIASNGRVAERSIDIGYQAGSRQDYTTGSQINIGRNAGYAQASGDNNINIGNYAGGGDASDTPPLVWNRGSEDCVFIGRNAGIYAQNNVKSVALGYQAGASSSGIGNSIMIGWNAGYATSGSMMGDQQGSMIAIGRDSLYESADTEQVVAIGNHAGAYGSGIEHSIFIGRGAGYKRGGGARNNVIISNRSTLPTSYDADWSQRHTGGLIDIASAIQGKTNTYVYMHIGEPLPTDTAEDGSIESRIEGAALNITKSRDSDNTLRLKLYTDSSNTFDINGSIMAPAMVSETWADVNNINGIALASPVKHNDNSPIVNKYGFLRLPFATDTIGSAANYQLLDERNQVIGKTAGAVAILEGGLLVGQPNPVMAYSDGTNWYVGSVGTQLS